MFNILVESSPRGNAHIHEYVLFLVERGSWHAFCVRIEQCLHVAVSRCSGQERRHCVTVMSMTQCWIDGTGCCEVLACCRTKAQLWHVCVYEILPGTSDWDNRVWSDAEKRCFKVWSLRQGWLHVGNMTHWVRPQWEGTTGLLKLKPQPKHDVFHIFIISMRKHKSASV